MNADLFRVAALAACVGCAQAAQAEDLLDAYRLALLQDPVLLSARHAYDAAQERLPQARAGLLPTVGLTANSGGQSGRSSFEQSAFADRTVRSRAWSLQLSQPLWRPANRIAYEQAEFQEQLAGEQLRQVRQESILRLAQAYFDALLAQESLRVAQGQFLAVQTQLDLAGRNHAVGTSTVTDVHEAQACRDLAQAQVEAAKNDVQTRFAEEAALAVAEAEVSRSEAAHGPTLDLVASYGRNSASGSMGSPADVSSRVNAAQVGVNLNIPLFAGGAVSARVREAVALRFKAEDDVETARRQAASQARQAWSGIRQGRLQLSALASAVVSSQSAVEDNKIGYRIGTRINIDVLNAEQQLYAAQRDLFKARVETLMHALRLKASGGLLDENDLAAVNRLLAVPV